MLANDRQQPLEKLSIIIGQLRNKGVALWVQDGTLHYRAPRGALTIEDRHFLYRENGAIASQLAGDSRSSGQETEINGCGHRRRFPLSFTQLAHWLGCRETLGRPIRQIASATRLRGPLKIDILNETLRAIVARHEALRTHIVLSRAGAPLQEVMDLSQGRLEVIHLGPISPVERAAEVVRHIDRAILEASDFVTSPLFQPMLLELGENEHVLVLALEHVISDGFSLNLLSREIFTAYSQLLNGDAIELPQIPVQFPGYAARLRARSAASFSSLGVRLDSSSRTRFPDSPSSDLEGPRMGAGLVRFLIDRALCVGLRDWATRNRTTLVTSVLTAYAALVLRWCEVTETVIQFVIDGRMTSDLDRTIGYFAFPLYIRAMIGRHDTLLDMLRGVMTAYCEAYDEADYGYVRSQLPRPGFTHNTCFNWLPNGIAGHRTVECESVTNLIGTELEFAHPVYSLHFRMDQEPSVLFTERDDCIIGELSYPQERFSEAAMKRFSNNVVAFLTVLVRNSSIHVREIELA